MFHINYRPWFVSLVLTAVFAFCAVGFGQTRVSNQRPDEHAARLEFAKKMLEAAQVPFDAKIITSRTWKKDLQKVFSSATAIPSELKPGGHIGGVLFADTLELTDSTMLDSDTVIVVRRLRYVLAEGKNTIEIKGPHRFAVFVADGAEFFDSYGNPTLPKSISIGVSGMKGVDGKPGKNGERGKDGEPGKNGAP